jgi:hypothetical protein
MSYRQVVWHIQFETVTVNGKADHVKVSLKLGEKQRLRQLGCHDAGPGSSILSLVRRKTCEPPHHSA